MRVRDVLQALGTHARGLGVLAVVTGLLTGLAVSLFDRVVKEETFERILEAPLWVQAAAPLIGLTIAALVLRSWGRGSSPATADEYVRNFHETDKQLDLSPALPRVVASAATLGGGAAMGFEG